MASEPANPMESAMKELRLWTGDQARSASHRLNKVSVLWICAGMSELVRKHWRSKRRQRYELLEMSLREGLASPVHRRTKRSCIF